MSHSSVVQFYRNKIKNIGYWAANRYLRNQGVRFEVAYFIMHNRLPVR